MIGFRLIKRSLQANAIFSLLTGLSMIILHKTFATIFETSTPLPFLVLGAGLLLFAGFVYWVSDQKNINQQMVKVITGMDILWVLGSVFLIATNYFSISLAGQIITAMTALIVAIFGFLQHTGLKAYISHLPEGRRKNK